MLTIVVICASYSQIIEQFPTGGGGYLVASKIALADLAGVVSGLRAHGRLCADHRHQRGERHGCIVQFVSIELAALQDGIFGGGNYFPRGAESALPGVKESVALWLPVFFLFLGTFTFAIFYGIISHVGDLPGIAHGLASDVRVDHAEIGTWGLIVVILRAYSLGAGTYTGIEAVSNGLSVLREPRVKTGKRTMVYMGASLAFVVGGLLLTYLLYHVEHVEGKTLNAILLEHMTASWPAWLGKSFVIAALASSAALLLIAAQTGFLGGPRVLANMAVDRWMPTRFATLSDRLVTQNGVVIMGIAALLVVLATAIFASGGLVNTLVVLYSINVFITFSLSQLGMVRHWWNDRAHTPSWKKKLCINGFGLLLTSGILISLCIVKFFEGGWITLLVTGLLIYAAFRVKRHYAKTQVQLKRLNDLVAAATSNETITNDPETPAPVCNSAGRTAVFLVNGFNGLGLHTLLAVIRMFPKVYQNFVFVQVGVLDAGNFKGAAEVDNLREHSQREVERYVAYMKRHGFYAESQIALGTDIVDEAAKLCDVVAHRFPNAQFFAGQLVFQDESLVTRLLHNHTVFELQRRLYRHGWPMLILPIQV